MYQLSRTASCLQGCSRREQEMIQVEIKPYIIVHLNVHQSIEYIFKNGDEEPRESLKD